MTNGIMKIGKEKAVRRANGTAKKNNLQKRSYRKAIPLSSLKIQIGEILLFLQDQSTEQIQWEVFDSTLRRYIDLKFCGGTHDG